MPYVRATLLRRGRYLAVGTLVVLLGFAAGADRARAQAPEAAFATLAQQGQESLAQVETPPDRGAEHLPRGATHEYEEPFPTSGIHAPSWVQPGYYGTPQRLEELVHSLEHGNVVIYQDTPGPEATALLRQWAGQFQDPWAGLIVVPRPGLGESVVLTAWNKRLMLDRFDPAAAAAFIDAFRGRGPENPVR